MLRKLRLITAMLVVIGVSQPTIAQESAEDRDAAARDYFSDTVLLNQNGEKVKFYSDVLKDRIVVINFMFANCQGACPLITQKMRMARDALGEETVKQIRFVSISIDSERDTPAALREFATRQHADGDWVFLTGEKDSVDQVVKKLGQYFPDVEEHSTWLIAGNVKTRYWMKIPPNVPAPGVAEKLRLLVGG